MIRRILSALVTVTALAWASPGFAQTLLTNTTLVADVTDVAARTINLTSTTSLVAGWVIYIDREAMDVVSVPDSTHATVIRGTRGTPASLHTITCAGGVLAPSTASANAASAYQCNVVFYGPPNYYKTRDPFPGPCTRSQIDYLPWINIQSGNIFSCIAGTWRGTSVMPFTYGSVMLAQWLEPVERQPRFRLDRGVVALAREWVGW